MWPATWPKLHSQQLPRGVQHAISAKKWGQGPFSNNFFYKDVIQTFFLQGRKSYLSLFKLSTRDFISNFLPLFFAYFLHNYFYFSLEKLFYFFSFFFINLEHTNILLWKIMFQLCWHHIISIFNNYLRQIFHQVIPTTSLWPWWINLLEKLIPSLKMCEHVYLFGDNQIK